MSKSNDGYCPIWMYYRDRFEEMGVTDIKHEQFDFYNKLLCVLAELEDSLGKKAIDKIVNEFRLKNES